MNGQDIGACIPEIREVAVRVDDHQVNIERFLSMLADGLDHGHAERDIGNEDAIHDIEVEPVGLAAVDHIDVTLQVSEVS